jgi:hypothetical protein
MLGFEPSDEVFEAVGYAQAEDRLFQIFLRIATATGRLAEFLGPGEGRVNVESDTDALRRSYTDAEVLAQFEALSEEARGMLSAFARGMLLRAAEVALGGLADCNVEVIDAKARTWKASYWPRVLDVIAGRPLLIRNAPPELFELVRELSHRDTLVQTFGSEVLRVRDSSPFTVMWGLDSSVDAVNRQLGEVVEGLFNGRTDGSAVSEGSSPRDVFSLQQTKMHGLFPRLFPYEKSVSLGLPGTGLTFHHAHGQAFLALVHGKKRWYLLR